jgi:[glutamine synthetase] adenylyltransferase / [glutamine synthetase]-adenylyl-L-tyrosine phosphorylase
MQNLHQILTENKVPSREAGYVLFAAECSHYFNRLVTKDYLFITDLLDNLYKTYKSEALNLWFIDKKNLSENAYLSEIRQIRQQVLAHLIVRDVNRLADFFEVSQTISAFAEAVINATVEYFYTQLSAIHGVPRAENGDQQHLIVIGMGKLGGFELNVSSDIDLIFAFEESGETDGKESISNQTFFTKLGKKIIAALDEITADGFVFRVDMRLRPFGSEGALVSNLNALEDYYQQYGREWERYAWIKGRVVCGPSLALEKALRPFVFRKYLDFNAYAAMRDLKLQIQRDVVQRGMDSNIKLGRGGIREVEFIAQLFQLIRGGQEVDLQIKPTLSVLKLLAEKRLLEATVVDELTESYIFLRNLEHRLMYVDDQQTQDLPRSEEAKASVAKMMHMPDWESLLTQLNKYRSVVQKHFDATFNDTSASKTIVNNCKLAQSVWQGIVTADESTIALRDFGYLNIDETATLLNTLHNSKRYSQLPQQSKARLDSVMPLLIIEAGQMVQPDTALIRVVNLLETISGRASYLALLAEFPDALALVVRLCAASPWLAQYLTAHPILLDELLSPASLYATPNFAQLKVDLEKKMQSLEGDLEAQMDAMRHFKHGMTMRFAAQDVMKQLPLETLSDYLSDLAQIILQVSLDTVWQNLAIKHQEKPNFAVIGYGKLGGKELGYVSDLDIIFLYEDAHDEAGAIYARFAQRINNWFNSLTNAGLLYETDLQLRPDGNSGLLVSSVAAFEQYQLNKAWVWEHQAITRARFVAGDASIGTAFDAIRQQVITQMRDANNLKKEVIDMREKMRAQHKPSATVFDIKQDQGGIIDVEFLVQFLVLKYAAIHPSLTQNRGNIALLHLLATLGLIPTKQAHAVANAYRNYRAEIHATRLQGLDAKVTLEKFGDEREAVKVLWQSVFND